jgi:gamma-glutamylcyclotransferase
MSKTVNLVNGIIFNGNSCELYYFAYGPNMNARQMTERCPTAKPIAVAKLSQHRLAFFGTSKVWDGGMETVVPDPARDVWGVIYKLGSSEANRLDVWQDARQDGTGAYFNYPTLLTDTQGVTRIALSYKKDILNEPRAPSAEFLNFIIQGAVENGLPSGYIDELRQTLSKPAQYVVPKRKNFGRELLAEISCSECGA